MKEEVQMIFGMTYYQICWYFLFYSFCGWVLEVIFHAAALGRIVNRGFLNGPICPIYGFGALAVFSLTGYLQQSELYLNDFSLFVSGVLLATLVELIAGWLMDKCFHARWWDYSDKPLNFHGYICLEFSLIWGVCVLLAVRLLQACVASRHIFHDPSTFGWVVLIIFYSTLAADLFVTILVLRGFNKTLTKLDSIHPGRGCNSWSRIPGISHLLFPHESPPIHLHHRALMTCLATPCTFSSLTRILLPG